MVCSKLLKEVKDYIAGGASSSTEEDSMSATGKYRKMNNVYFTNIQENYLPLFIFLKPGTVDIHLLSLLLQVDSSKSSYSSEATSCLHPISASHFLCFYHTGTLSCQKSLQQEWLFTQTHGRTIISNSFGTVKVSRLESMPVFIALAQNSSSCSVTHPTSTSA